MDFEGLLRTAVEGDASDVHLQVGGTPMMRVRGELRVMTTDVLGPHEVRDFIAAIVPPSKRTDLEGAAARGLEFSHEHAGLARFRCSAYRHGGQLGLVLRIVPPAIPTLDELRLPHVLRDIALSRRGLTLVTGSRGSGKTSTLAALLGIINTCCTAKVITIEEPLEYVHTSQESLVTHFEVGSDTPALDQALRQALRQDPDVILVGALPDLDTVRLALRAADIGHQVLSAAESGTATQAIERLVALFPAGERELLRDQLAAQLEAVIAQRLVHTTQGDRRPAVEILRGTAPTQKLILEDRLDELVDCMQTGESGMQTFDQDLLKMYNDGLITGTEALRSATRPDALSVAMRSGPGTGGRRLSP